MTCSCAVLINSVSEALKQLDASYCKKGVCVNTQDEERMEWRMSHGTQRLLLRTSAESAANLELKD